MCSDNAVKMNDIRGMEILEAKQLLIEKGSVSITLDKKMARQFRACSRRIDKVERLLRGSGIFKRSFYYVYAAYTSIVNSMLIAGNEDLDQAVHLHMVCWEYLGQIHAEPEKGNNVTITFNKST